MGLMQQGVECIYKGVLLATHSQELTLLSRPALLIKQPGQSRFGNWVYVPAQIELGKRPKLEYQIVAAFHAQVLATVQQAEPETAWLLLRRKEAYAVYLPKWIPQMQRKRRVYSNFRINPSAGSIHQPSAVQPLSVVYSVLCFRQIRATSLFCQGERFSRYTLLQARNLTLESLANTSPA